MLHGIAGTVKSYYPCIEEDWPENGGRVWKLGWVSCGWNPAVLDWSWGTKDPWGWKPLLKSWGTIGDWVEDPEGLTLNN